MARAIRAWGSAKPEDTATLLTNLLVAEQLRRGTGVGARAASCRDQAILALRWFREEADMKLPAADTQVSIATADRYLHEGIGVLAAQAPDLHEVLEQGKAAGWSHVTLDGTLIETDRCRVKNPDTGHDLWYFGKHGALGGNVQVVCDPEGFPAAVSEVEPGSTHDLAAARATGFLGALYAAAALLGLPTLADKSYDGAGAGAGILTKDRGLQPEGGAPRAWRHAVIVPRGATVPGHARVRRSPDARGPCARNQGAEPATPQAPFSPTTARSPSRSVRCTRMPARCKAATRFGAGWP